jgi:hypothetical protein
MLYKLILFQLCSTMEQKSNLFEAMKIKTKTVICLLFYIAVIHGLFLVKDNKTKMLNLVRDELSWRLKRYIRNFINFTP